MSDLHITPKNYGKFEREIIPALKQELIGMVNEHPVDLICFSGDIISMGGDGFSTIYDALKCFQENFINALLSVDSLGYLKKRIVICPGNHEVERSKIDPIFEKGIKATLKEKDGYELCLESYEKNLSNFERINQYKLFESEFYKSQDTTIIEQSQFQVTASYAVDHGKIGVLSLNSVWRSTGSNNDYGSLLLSIESLNNATDMLKSNDIRVALVHHHFSYYHSSIRDQIESLFHKNFDILLCGHAHHGKSSYSNTLSDSLLISIAPNLNPDNKNSDSIDFSVGFTVIDYNLKELLCTLNYKRYCGKSKEFIPNLDITDNGIVIYRLPDVNSATEVQKQASSVRASLRSEADILNDHLLSSIANTNAPKSIESIFVDPPIYRKKEFTEENGEKTTYVNIDHIIRQVDNSVILGLRESGKTILLDRIYIEYLNNYDLYHVIPVRLDYSDLGYRDIINCIRHYLRIPLQIFMDFLSHYEIVLLLDNLVIQSSDIQNKHIKEFIQEYPNIRIVSTYNSNLKDEVPIEILNDPVFCTFETYHIDDYKTKHIRSLVCNWFCNAHDKTFTEKKLDSIKQIILSFNLPRNPLSISMFLWIIEQQETYRPQNQAAMVENFVDNLLEKTRLKNVFSDDFNFGNKLHLLSDIAKKMLFENKINYRIPKLELCRFIEDRFVQMGFKLKISSDDIVEEFTRRGLLIIEIEEMKTYVRFKFKFLFQFFLAKAIEYDNAFAEYVMDSNRYLMYYETIDYYTAIKRNSRDYLEMAVERMNEIYAEINKVIDGFEFKHDQIYKNHGSLVERSDSKKLITAIKQSKPTPERLDEIDDGLLQESPIEKGIPSIENQLETWQKLERSWILAANCLRNGEEIDNSDNYKKKAYDLIIKCSMSFAFVYKLWLNERVKDGANDKEKILYSVLPLFHQLLLKNLIGTKKLELIFKQVIEERISNREVTDFEKYIDVFLYSDIKGDNYPKYIKQLMRNTRHKYIKDMILFKLITYYYLRTISKEDAIIYEDLIGDILTKNKKQDPSRKSKEIKRIRDQKKASNRNKDED